LETLGKQAVENPPAGLRSSAACARPAGGEASGGNSMNPIYVPLLSALAGAIIGSVSSIATILIQAKIGERRERIRQAMMFALDHLAIGRAAGSGFLLGLLPAVVPHFPLVESHTGRVAYQR
jgi:hypothetical protein